MALISNKIALNCIYKSRGNATFSECPKLFVGLHEEKLSSSFAHSV